jgi:hypothetical protein
VRLSVRRLLPSLQQGYTESVSINYNVYFPLILNMGVRMSKPLESVSFFAIGLSRQKFPWH